MRAAGDQARDVRDVGCQHGADLLGDRGEPREVDRARDRGAAAPDQLRPLAQGEFAHLVEVDDARLAAHAVANGAEPTARDRHAPAVREVPAGVERHAEHGVAGLEERRVHGEVRGRAGERLDVGVLDAEQRLRALRRERLDSVDDQVSLVVAPRRVALRVLVREDGPGRGEHGGRDVVLGRDQAERVVLSRLLGGDQFGDAGVGGFEDGGHGHLRTVGFGAQARGGQGRIASRWSVPPEAPVTTRPPSVPDDSAPQARLHQPRLRVNARLGNQPCRQCVV